MATQTSVPFEQNTEGEYLCPDCGAAYATSQGTRRHMTEKHGWPRSPKTSRKPKEELVMVEDEDSVSFQVRSNLREMASPLKEQMASIDRRLVEIGREQIDLREARRQIEKTLQYLEGTPAPAKGAPDFSRADFQAKFAATEKFLADYGDSLDKGFTATDLARAMKEAGVKPVASPEKVRAIIKQLHERGVVRVDRVAKGGGNLYMLVGRNGAKEE